MLVIFFISLFILVFGIAERGQFDIERYDRGDAFSPESSKDCHLFNAYPSLPTRDCNTTLRCCCEYGKTFDSRTGSGKCESLYDENSKGGSYRFDRYMLDTDTSVSTMQAYCSQDECILLSTATNDMMPVAYKNSKELPGLCTVVDINIIHDCQPRKLPQVTAKLEQNSFDKYYYLRSESIPHGIIPLFGGELLQVPINCSNHPGYLFFKFAGKTVLNQDKKFLNEIIPRYDPSHSNGSYCASNLPMPGQSHGLGRKKILTLVYIGVAVIVLVFFILALIGIGYKKSRRHREETPLLVEAVSVCSDSSAGSPQSSVSLSSSSENSQRV